METIPINITENNIVFLMLFAFLVLASFCFFYYKLSFSYIFKFFPVESIENNYLLYILIHVIYVGSLSFLIWINFENYFLNFSAQNILITILSLIFIKFLLSMIVFKYFNQSLLFKDFLSAKNYMRYYVGVLALFLSFVSVYSDLSFFYSTKLLLLLLGFTQIYMIVKTSLRYIILFKTPFLYIFLYLCALEIAPLLFLYKYYKG